MPALSLHPHHRPESLNPLDHNPRHLTTSPQTRKMTNVLLKQAAIQACKAPQKGKQKQAHNTQPCRSHKLKILQHYVQHWHTRRLSLINTYMHESHDIILINSRGLSNHQTLKMPGYTCCQQNRTGEEHTGVAIEQGFSTTTSTTPKLC